MQPYKRSARVGDLLREEIAMIIMNRIKDPRVGFLTVTAVKVTDDLKQARVYVSVLDRERKGEIVDILNSARGFIRSELSRTVRLKYMPRLDFFYDESIEYGEKIDRLIDGIREGQ